MTLLAVDGSAKAHRPLLTRVEFFALRDAPELLVNLLEASDPSFQISRENSLERLLPRARPRTAKAIWRPLVEHTLGMLRRWLSRFGDDRLAAVAFWALTCRVGTLGQYHHFALPRLSGLCLDGTAARSALHEKALLTALLLWPRWRLRALLARLEHALTYPCPPLLLFDPLARLVKDEPHTPRPAELRSRWAGLLRGNRLLHRELCTAHEALIERNVALACREHSALGYLTSAADPAPQKALTNDRDVLLLRLRETAREALFKAVDTWAFTAICSFESFASVRLRIALRAALADRDARVAALARLPWPDHDHRRPKSSR